VLSRRTYRWTTAETTSVISPELEAEILRLHHAEKWPVGTIFSQLHVRHRTVRRVLAQGGNRGAANASTVTVQATALDVV
jgi:hypothetical protein